MNNKEFLAELSRRMNISVRDTTALMTGLVAEITNQLEEENVISIQGFGNFEVKKKLERVVVNPGTKPRMLVPTTMVLNFRVSSTMKERLNA